MQQLMSAAAMSVSRREHVTHPSPFWPQHIFNCSVYNLVLCTLLWKGIWLHRHCWFRNFELMARDIILYTWEKAYSNTHVAFVWDTVQCSMSSTLPLCLGPMLDCSQKKWEDAKLWALGRSWKGAPNKDWDLEAWECSGSDGPSLAGNGNGGRAIFVFYHSAYMLMNGMTSSIDF